MPLIPWIDAYSTRIPAFDEEYKLLNFIMELQQRLIGGDDALLSEASRFLRHWMVDHIQQIDKKYGAFFLEQGVH